MRQSIEVELKALRAELEHVKNASDEDVCMEYNVDCRQDIVDDVEHDIQLRMDELAELDEIEAQREYNDWLGWHEGEPDPAFSSTENINGMFGRK